MMSIADRILDVSFNNLSRLYDADNGGFFFHIDKNNHVDGHKLLRYNARVIELLTGYYDANALRYTASYVVATFPVLNNNCFGDIGLLVTALDKIGYPNKDVPYVLRKRLVGTPVHDLKRIVVDRILWILESCNIEGLKDYVFVERKLKRKFFGVNHVCVSTVLYAIHYLTVKGFYEEAMVWYRFLVGTFFLDNGEWTLSYFPSLHWTYRKAFSVHQLGMAPLYLLELYEKVHEESILHVVQKSIEFGYSFLNDDRVCRNLGNNKTRCYECAFDIRGLMKAIEHGVA